MTHPRPDARRLGPPVHLRLIGWLLVTCFAMTALYAIQPGYALLAGNRAGIAIAIVDRTPAANAAYAPSQPDGKAQPNDKDNSGKAAKIAENTERTDRPQSAHFATPETSQPARTRPDRKHDVVNRSVESPDHDRPAEATYEELDVTASLSNSLGGLTSVGRSLTRQLHNAATAVHEATKPTLQQLLTAKSLSQTAPAPHTQSTAADASDGKLSSGAETAVAPEWAIVHNRERGEVHYLLNSQVVSLAPGESRELPGPGPWNLRFHRGGDFGESTVTLYGGNYDFAIGETGWNVRRRPADDESRAD